MIEALIALVVALLMALGGNVHPAGPSTRPELTCNAQGTTCLIPPATAVR